MERQIVRGFIDGALSTLGVVIGASAGEVGIIISAGIGGGIANGISNVFGALTAERVEEEKGIRELEKSMLAELKETKLYEEVRRRVVVRGLIDGLSTIFGSFVPVFPFVLSRVLDFGVQMAVMLSITLTATSLGVIGVYFGKVSRENVVVSSAKMILMGLFTAIVSILIERGLHGLV